MKKGFVTNWLVIGIFCYLPLHSFAWGMEGHRIAGEIANSYLTPKAKKEIQKILGNESIAIASNWPDFIKSDPAYKYLNTWHYIDFDGNITYDQMKVLLQKDTAADAYTKTNFLIGELKNKSLPQDKKLLYLRMLIHIIEDMHQPLHVSKNGTNGGNNVKVLWFKDTTNLHSVWDSELIDYQQLSYTEYVKAINFSTKEQRAAWQSDDMSKWLFESFEISNQLHDEIKQPYQKLLYVYNFNHIQTLNEQLLKAGVRLAGVLNRIFG